MSLRGGMMSGDGGKRKREYLDQPVKAPAEHVVEVLCLVCKVVACGWSGDMTSDRTKADMPLPKSVAPQHTDMTVKDWSHDT